MRSSNVKDLHEMRKLVKMAFALAGDILYSSTNEMFSVWNRLEGAKGRQRQRAHVNPVGGRDAADDEDGDAEDAWTKM